MSSMNTPEFYAWASPQGQKKRKRGQERGSPDSSKDPTSRWLLAFYSPMSPEGSCFGSPWDSDQLPRCSTKENVPRAHSYTASSSSQPEPNGNEAEGVSHLSEGQQERRQSLVIQRTALVYAESR